VHKLLCAGYTDVVDADLSKYFDTIPHCQLIHSVARRIVDREILRLIKAWLKVPVEERDEKGNRRMTGGKSTTQGTPQGGVVSPMLANLYMNRFLKFWRITERGKAFQAHVVNYADDFVILTQRHATGARDWTREVMTRLGLTLNETKTKLKEARAESF
jgi:RNA-directed DNA polymerase